MASKKEASVVLNFEANGAIEMAKTTRELNTIMNTASKEYKAQVAAMGDDATATEKLTALQKKLATQFEAAQKRTKLVTAEFDEMKASGTATANDLAKMNGKVLDAQRYEASLGNQLDKVNTQLSDNGKSALEAKDKLSNLESENAQLAAKQKELTSSIKLENSEMGENATEAQKLEVSQKQLSSQINLSKQVVANLEQQLRETKTAYGENSTEASQMAAKLNGAKTAVSDLENKLDTLGNSSKSAGTDMEQLNSKVDANNLMEAGNALSGVGDKAKGMAGSVISAANDYANGQTKMQASMGGTSEKAQDMMGVVKDVMSNGVVGSVDEAVDAVSNVKTAFGDLNDTDLADLTDKITTLSERTGTDYNDNIQAASMLNKSFGVSGKEAMDMIATGFQNGANSSGDFLDTVHEYSPQFKDAGFSAQQMMSIITAGAKTGAFNTDKAADAVKELGLKMTDSSTSVDTYFGQFSKHTQGLVKDLRNGKATSADVTKSIAKDLKNMTPAEQKSALSALGTQFEDLGNKASVSLLSAAGSTTKVTGGLDAMSKHTAAEKLTGSLNKLKASFSDLLQGMTPVIEEVAKIISKLADAPQPVKVLIAAFAGLVAGLTALAPAVISASGIFKALGPVISTLAGGSGLGKLGSVFSKILPMFGKLGSVLGGAFGLMRTAIMAILPVIGSMLSALLPLLPLIITIGGSIALLVMIIKNWGKIWDVVKELWTAFKGWLSGFWEGIKNIFTTALTAIVNVFKTIWGGIKDFLTLEINGWKLIITTVWNAIKTVFTTVLNAIKTVVTTVWQAISTATSTAWNAIKSVVQTVWNGIKSVVTTVVNAVKSAISTAWNAIKSTTSSVFNSIKSVASSVWNALKSVVTSVVNGVKSAVSSAWNAIKSTTSSVFNSVKSVATSVWDGIKSAISSVVNAIKSVVSGAWNGVKSATSSAFNAVKNTISSVMNAAHSIVTGIVNKIKSAFNVHLSFPAIHIPHIPLPHLTVHGGFSIKPPRVPSFGVSWRAKGAIFTTPTIFGMNGSNLQGAGDAGPEAALPLNAETLAGIGKGIAANMNGNAGQPILLQIDGRTFAELSGPYMSGYVAQQDASTGFNYGKRPWQ